MRTLLMVIVSFVGCARTADERTAEQAWRVGLTNEQVAAVQTDKEACSEMYRKLLDAAGDPARGTVEHLGLIRLKNHYEEYLSEIQVGNLKTAAPHFRQLIEGKDLTDLAWEQSAEAPKVGR